MVLKIKKILAILGLWRTWLLLLAMLDKKFRELIYKDLDANKYLCIYKNTKNIWFLNYLILFNLTFRAQYYYRLKYENHNISFYFSQLFVPNKKDLELWGKIDGGLQLFHGQGIVCVVNKAGENLSIYQGVTIGRNPKGAKNGIDTPSLGDNVSIYTNAVVVGNIKIGSNVKIGAGAVVVKDVPDNCTVVGNPMKIIQH